MSRCGGRPTRRRAELRRPQPSSKNCTRRSALRGSTYERRQLTKSMSCHSSSHSSCSGSWHMCGVRSGLTLIGCDSLQLVATIRAERALESQRRARVRACSCCNTLRGQCQRQQRCGHQRRGMRTHRGEGKVWKAAGARKRRLASHRLCSRCASAIRHCRPLSLVCPFPCCVPRF